MASGTPATSSHRLHIQGKTTDNEMVGEQYAPEEDHGYQLSREMAL